MPAHGPVFSCHAVTSDWTEFISQPALLPLTTLPATVLDCIVFVLLLILFVILKVLIFSLPATTLTKSESKSSESLEQKQHMKQHNKPSMTYTGWVKK